MKTTSATAWATSRLKRITTKAPNTSAAIPARWTAPLHVGGLSRRSVRRWREICLASSRVRGRPVRPARSIVPAGVPRCLRVRLRLVCAIAFGAYPARAALSVQRRQRLFEYVALRAEAVQRDVGGEAVEGRTRREADQLGLGDR